MCTYADEQGGDGRTFLIVDHGQQAGEVTFSSSREAQPVDRKTSPNLAAASLFKTTEKQEARLTWKT